MDEVERSLWFEKISREQLAPTLAREGASSFALGEQGEWYQAEEGWYPVRHAFELQEDGSGIFTVLFEREAGRT